MLLAVNLTLLVVNSTLRAVNSVMPVVNSILPVVNSILRVRVVLSAVRVVRVVRACPVISAVRVVNAGGATTYYCVAPHVRNAALILLRCLEGRCWREARSHFPSRPRREATSLQGLEPFKAEARSHFFRHV